MVFRPLEPHPVQSALWRTKARFPVAACGRRSGKSEIAKRKICKAAITCPYPDGWFVYSAPTRDQAKRIAWQDLQRMLLDLDVVKRCYTSDLTIKLNSGVEVCCVGMDRPERIEGRILDGIVLDEYANMRPEAWEAHVRPALSTRDREGWALFVGTPEGRNHFWQLFMMASDPRNQPEWEAFTWKSADIISPRELAIAKANMDPIMFAQEYEASFTTFDGLAYYSFDRAVHAKQELHYKSDLPLVFSLDFNVSPGTAAVIQEYEGYTNIIGQVWIAKGSNTRMVAEKLREDWRHHQRDIYLYGDATGGNKHSQSTDGSDWDIVRGILRPVFTNRLKWRIGSSNPPVRARVNAVNARLRTADDKIHMRVCPFKAAKVVEDFEAVTVIPGTAGELDKYSDPDHSHLTDEIGYYTFAVHPTTARFTATTYV